MTYVEPCQLLEKTFGVRASGWAKNGGARRVIAALAGRHHRLIDLTERRGYGYRATNP